MSKNTEHNEQNYPILLFSISKDGQVIGMFRDKDAEVIKPISKNVGDVDDLVWDWLGGMDYVEVFDEGESELGDEDYRDGWYYRLVELAQQEIQKDHPELVLSKIEIDRIWTPGFPRRPLVY